ncbi:myosin-binding protein 1-like [Neltuma alba]|uniref:myosin-binding protein 1-like n=1 Tax=Neltuma alba TaxID=207710 RepID=UPI0010A2D77E|nr:myosin-binding protein 1-like [Prosopis alba]
MAAVGVSSANSHNLSAGITAALASALLEWLLISFLFVDAVFSFIITKFAGHCKLQIPCLLCSRLDHVLGKEKKGYYWDLICRGHKLEISALILCCAHDKLVNVHGMCEDCLFSFAKVNKSSSENYQLLLGKLGEGSKTPHEQDWLLDDHKISLSTTKQCSCCDEPRVSWGNDPRLVLTKSVRSEATEFDIPSSSGDVGIDLHEKRRSEPRLSVRATHLRRISQIDPLSHVGYTELKITSDSESDVALSDDDDVISTPIRETHDTNEDINVQCVQREPHVIDLDEDLASEKPLGSPSPCKPSIESEPGMHSGYTDTHGSKSAAPVTVEASKETCDDLTTCKVGLTSEQRSTIGDEEIIKPDINRTTSEAGLVLGENGQQYPNLLDLGDAYKLAVSNRGRQLSGMLAEQWLGKDSSRISEDLKILLSQLSAARGTDLSANDLSPRLSVNSDEAKTSDASNSAGMQILQKRVSLERNESGLSLDGSIVSEIEGESAVDRLKRQVDHDRKLMSALYKELEEERNASAVAATQALAMITRLQEEKATLHMEALQCLRMMEEQSEYETEALQKANNLLAEKGRELEDLEAELEYFRKKYPDESTSQHLTQTSSDMEVKDIGLDQPQSSRAENRESIHSISDKAAALNIALEEKNIDPVKNPQSEFDNERLYVLQELKKLETQVYGFINVHRSAHNIVNSEYQENCGKFVNNQPMQDSVSSSEKPPVCDENGRLEYDVIGRLRVLEADQRFLEHTINILRNREEGLELLREIADRLQELRKIGIREIDQPDISGCIL